MMNKLANAMKSLEGLTTEELLRLNKTIVTTIKGERAKQNQKLSLMLKRDDKVKFDAKRRGIIYGTIIDVKRTAAHVMAADGKRWRVALTLLQKVA